MATFKTLKSIVLGAAIALSLSAFAGEPPLWADLSDIVKYTPTAMPDAAVILKSLAQNPAAFLPEGADSKIAGTIALQSEPSSNSGLTTYPDVTALVQSKSKGYFYRRYSISVLGVKVQDVKILEDMKISELHFQIDAGLVPRMLAVNDPEHDIQMVYPLGVGGIDPGVMDPGRTSLLTPLFQNATLKRRTVTAHRTDPSYYRGLPFMPITNARGSETAIGFHISILTDPLWKTKGGNFLVRGFESHGCMRMRQKDLMELFTIVEDGGSEALPVSVNYYLYNRGADGRRDQANGELPNDQPYPLNEAYYQRVQNFGSSAEPKYERDPKEHLVILQQTPGLPDLSRIVPNGEDTSSKAVDELTAGHSLP